MRGMNQGRFLPSIWPFLYYAIVKAVYTFQKLLYLPALNPNVNIDHKKQQNTQHIRIWSYAHMNFLKYPTWYTHVILLVFSHLVAYIYENFQFQVYSLNTAVQQGYNKKKLWIPQANVNDNVLFKSASHLKLCIQLLEYWMEQIF